MGKWLHSNSCRKHWEPRHCHISSFKQHTMFKILQNAQEKNKKLGAVFSRKAIMLKCVERCHQFQLHLKEKIIKIQGWDGIFLMFNFLQLSLLLIYIHVYITCLQFFLLHFVQMRVFKKVISAFMNWIILWFQNFHFYYPWAQKSIPSAILTLEVVDCTLHPQLHRTKHKQNVVRSGENPTLGLPISFYFFMHPACLGAD